VRTALATASCGARPHRSVSTNRASALTPDLYVQYFRDIRDATAGGRPPTAQLITDLMARYGTEPAGVPDR
jgi:hypothetical protein